MDAVATVTLADGQTKTYQLDPMEVAQIAAHRAGFFDLDLDCTAGNGVSFVATGYRKTLKVRGKTVEQACINLLNQIGE